MTGLGSNDRGTHSTRNMDGLIHCPQHETLPVWFEGLGSVQLVRMTRVRPSSGSVWLESHWIGSIGWENDWAWLHCTGLTQIGD